MITIKVTHSDGDHHYTDINATLAEAKAYFLGRSTDKLVAGREVVYRFTSVCLVSDRKIAYVRDDGYGLAVTVGDKCQRFPYLARDARVHRQVRDFAVSLGCSHIQWRAKKRSNFDSRQIAQKIAAKMWRTKSTNWIAKSVIENYPCFRDFVRYFHPTIQWAIVSLLCVKIYREPHDQDLVEKLVWYVRRHDTDDRYLKHTALFWLPHFLGYFTEVKGG